MRDLNSKWFLLYVRGDVGKFTLAEELYNGTTAYLPLHILQTLSTTDTRRTGNPSMSNRYPMHISTLRSTFIELRKLTSPSSAQCNKVNNKEIE